MNYEPLGLIDFGRRLVETGDLDPVYIGAVGANMGETQRNRWLLAYILFYHVGFASWASEADNGEEFMDRLMTAAENKVPAPPGGRWPRASERRHFRGDFAVKSIQQLKTDIQYGFKPEEVFAEIASKAPDVVAMRKYAELFPGIGGWASFKIADLVDRVMGIPVNFDYETAMYDSPRKGVALFGKENGWEGDESSQIKHTLRLMKQNLGDLKAPPFEDRPLAMNEYETILCKWVGHQKGRYPIGKDILEVEHAAKEWVPYSPTAGLILGSMRGLKDKLHG